MAKLETVKFHTGYGETHEIGDVYELEDEAAIDNVTAQGLAKRVDAVEAAPPKPSQPVEPMTSANFAKPDPAA